MTERENYIVHLVALPGWRIPAIKRLRAFLKAALRCWGFRCTSIAEATQDAQEFRQ